MLAQNERIQGGGSPKQLASSGGIVGINVVEHSALNMFLKKIGSLEFLWMAGGRRSKGLFTFELVNIIPPRSEVLLEGVRAHVFVQ